MTEPLHIPGANTLKVWMVKLASAPTRSTQNNAVLEDLMRQCYAEIRAYRIAGHGWGKLAIQIRKECKVPCSDETLKVLFTAIDKEWSKRTGEPPLPEKSVKARMREREAMKKKKEAA